MADSEKAQNFYYSAHHLARDLFWNAGNFAFFLVLGTALNRGFRDDIWSVITAIAELDSSVIQIAASVASLALGAVAGIIATQVYVSLTWGLRFSYVPILSRLTYDGWYQKDSESLRELYNRVFGQDSELLLQRPKPIEFAIRLTSYLRFHNPSGYVHVFRTYSIVALFRQAIIYMSIFLIWSIQGKTALGPGFLVGALLILMLAQREAITMRCPESTLLYLPLSGGLKINALLIGLTAMNGKLETIATFNDLTQAQAALAVLKAEGIASELQDEMTGSIDWGLMPALGGLRLQVDTAAVQRALDVLKDFDAETTSPAPLTSGDNPDEPSDVEELAYRERSRRHKRLVVLVSFLILFLPVLLALFLGWFVEL